MKKINNSNPLKTFNDNKAMAYKKAGGAMTAYKKSLTKAQMGMDTGRIKKNEPIQPEAKMATLPAGRVTPPIFNSDNSTYVTGTGNLFEKTKVKPGESRISMKPFINVPAGETLYKESENDARTVTRGTMNPRLKKGGPVKRKKK